MENYASYSTKNYIPTNNDNLFSDLIQQYERVIVDAIITSFGMDFLIKDQHGGDVDTINNVRKVGVDSEMTYKSKSNNKAYENRGEYSYAYYHPNGNSNFSQIKHNARNEFLYEGKAVHDEYEDKDLFFSGKSKNADPSKSAELDHIIEAKQIHDDRGRVLAGFDGRELDDAPENLAFTNKSLNASMGSWSRQKNEQWKKTHNGQDAPMSELDMKAYLKEHPEIDENTKSNMLKKYEEAKSSYENKIATKYYCSKQFKKDTAIAATKVGLKMGTRQVLGFIFTEIWFSIKDELEQNNSKEFDLQDTLISIGKGIEKGFISAKYKYKDLINKFLDGATAGVLASLSTTLINIFLTTSKNTVKLLRQCSASLIQAIKILFINPDCYAYGDKVKAAMKILATGASVVLGITVNEAIDSTPAGKLPVIGEIISTFCGTLATGILTCTLLMYLDRSKAVNNMVQFLNEHIHTMDDEVRYFKERADFFEQYAANLFHIDYEELKKEGIIYQKLSQKIDNLNGKELNKVLLNTYNELGYTLPWTGDFNTFMSNKNNTLKFC